MAHARRACRLAARRARTLPVVVRDGGTGGRVVVVEELLKDPVDAEHTGHLAPQAVPERAPARRRHRGRGGAVGPGDRG
ncbi:hypothetical protein, partial [Streptomyces hygroscopicus]